MKKTTLATTALICTASALLWPIMGAQAGFEFKNAAGVVASPSVQSSTSPVIAPAQVMKEELALPMPGDNLSDLAPVTPPPMATNDQTIIAGFGKDVPLAIALEQIIPAGFAPAPAEDINMGQIVTWEGGKPWPDVLNATLAPLNLTASIDGKSVKITPVAPVQFPTPDDPMPELAATDMTPIDLAPATPAEETQGTIAAPGNLDTTLVDDLSPNQPRRVITQAVPDIAEPPPPQDRSDLGLQYSPPLPSDNGPMALPMAAAPPADIGRVDVWTALAGQDLRATLDAWSHRVNVRLVWESPYMYAVQDTQSDARPYSDAITSLLDQFENTGVGPKPQATLYQGNGLDPAVLVIR